MLADEVDSDRLIATFLDLVAIDSPTGHEEQIGRELEARFTALGCTVSKDDIGNLVAVLPGTRPDTVLLSTHMDTAGTDTGIRPIIEDGIIKTDGTTILGADDKSGIAGCLELLTILESNPGVEHPTLEFVISVGEESGLLGSRQMDLSRLSSTYGFVFDTAGAIGAITYWTPTSVYITATIHGKKAHAGVEPEKGINAVKVAAEAIAAMPLGRIDEETVANIGTITGGEARNIVPGEVNLQGMARSHDQEKLDAQLDAMRSALTEAADRHGATLDFEAEEIYRTYHIDESERPLPRGGPRDQVTGARRDSTKERRGDRWQLLQRPRDSLCRHGHRHGRRARLQRAHCHRGHGHGVQNPRDDRHPGTGMKGAAR